MTETRMHQARRDRLARAIGDGIAIVPTSPERARNRDTHYPYRFDSYFYYLTGFAEPESVLVVVGGAAPRSILFCRDKDPEREIWDGFRHGPEAARAAFGMDEACAIGEIDSRMPDLLANRASVYCRLGVDGEWDVRVMGWVNAVRGKVRAGVSAPGDFHDLHAVLDEMRLVKDATELHTMRRAAAVSAAAHRRAMLATRPGRHEYEIEAELLHEFRRSGAQAPAYTSIVAAGANACVLHYVQNDAQLGDGDLLLIDAGCEIDGYASDITRTFPVNGRFSAAQRDVYEIVLAAQRAAMDAVRTGTPWNVPHDAAVRVIASGLIDLGLLAGSVDAVLETESYKRFYMHRTGHWLGLDVHDAGEYKRGGTWRALEPGMVLTVEPGCYIRPGAGVPAAFENIGIRIEDDVVVTDDVCEVITAAAPKQIRDIEELMRAARD